MATGGAQNVLLTLAQWFQRQGYCVVVAFFYDRDGLQSSWEQEYSFPVINLGGWTFTGSVLQKGGLLVSGLLRLYRLLISRRFQVVMTFTHHSNLLGLPVAWAAGVPVRVATHHGRIHNFSSQLERLHAWMVNSRITTRLVAVSASMREAAIEEGVKPERISIIPNGIELHPTDLQARTRARQLLGVGPDIPVILSVGRLTPEKGHTCFLDAIPGILAQIQDAHFFLAGDGILRSNLEQQAKRLNIDSRVTFLGMRQDVALLLAGADIFVLPSISEGLPLALMEAMSAELAVVASDVGGVKEVVGDGKTGLLVQPGNPAGLTCSVVNLLNDPKERIRLGEAARKLIEEKYSLDRMCNLYAQLFSRTMREERE
jgi:glycosyltransferase involved in cell wall biosynthesis